MPGLRGGEPWCVERLDDGVREVPLIARKARRRLPAELRSDAVVNAPRFRPVQLVRAPVQVLHLLKQRLEWLAVHKQPCEVTAGGLTVGRNLQGMGPPAAVRAPLHIRSKRADFVLSNQPVTNTPASPASSTFAAGIYGH